MQADEQQRPVSSPCTGICRLDNDGLCVGCRRSMREIAAWRGMDEAERLRLMRDVLPLRAAKGRVA